MHETLNIVWFKRDLRIYDHHVLTCAAQQGRVLPLYIVEPELWQQSDMSHRQWAFTQECLVCLREALANLGQPLIIRIGNAIQILEQARQRFKSIHLWSHEETGNAWTYRRDQDVAAWARQAGVQWTELPQSGVIRRLKSRNGWAQRWDKMMAVAQHKPPIALSPLDNIQVGIIPCTNDLSIKDDYCRERQIGGRKVGLKTLDSFLTYRGASYRRALSNPTMGAVHCSRLSPYIALGVLSMKEITQATWTRQKDLKEQNIKGGWRGSIASFQGRLHWRDHFIQKLEDAPTIEYKNLHKAYDTLRSGAPDIGMLQAWEAGETGFPFVDACMRSLRVTGWLNFRMRAMLMSFSSYHLWLNWKKPGTHLARLFTDYEPGIHWSQVQMQSGTTGINAIRIYNPIKQGYDQDPQGAFVRKWVPELSNIPDDFIHEPWKWDRAGHVLDKTYPLPIIDHISAAQQAREKVWAIRKTDDFKKTAKGVVAKHASRKAARKPRKKSIKHANQLTLPL